MSTKLKKSPKIWKLAKDLGIRHPNDPVSDILSYCNNKVEKFLKDFPTCKTLSDLLDCIAGKVGTVFEEIHTDDDLKRIKSKYLKLSEKIFVNLEKDLSDDVYGITFKRTNRDIWEREYISVIDCRSNKALRSYYTKWHEIAHLLILTDQMRLYFRRTNYLPDKDPEEILVDVVAGTFGFYPPIVRKYPINELSFESIDNLRAQLCPEASQQSSLIGFVKAWQNPCLLVYGQLALKKQEQEQLNQLNFEFSKSLKPALRATKVTSNEAALKEGLRIFENMRIPQQSIIHRIFENGDMYGEGYENLSWWETSDGIKLPDTHIHVKTKRLGDSIYALIIPVTNN